MGALVLGLALACYWPALRGAPVWDDDAHITKPELRSAAGLGQIWTNPHATQQYYPLLHSAFWIEYRMWGDSVVGYHLANVLMHAAAAGLLILILRRLNAPGAWLAGLFFVVHPVCVESVAWISEQKNTLSLVLYLLAAMAYLRFDEDRRRPSALPTYALALMLFVMALLTKSVTATLPAALLVIAWWQRGRLAWRRDVLPLAPWFALATASGLLTAWVERKIIGAEGASYDLTLVQRCLLAARDLWFYAGKLFWPSHLVFVYQHWDPRSQSTGWVLYLAAALLVTFGLWLLRRRMRGPLAAWLFFAGSLFPALGFFNVFPFVFSYVADHFQYLASLGIFTAVAAGAALILDRASPLARSVGLGLVSVLVATLAFLSNVQSRTYIDASTLYKATIERNPDCWMAHNNLGVIYSDRGDLVSAVAEYKEAIRLKADYAEAQDNLGGVLLKIPDRLNEAVAHFKEALRLDPGFAAAHNNLANALMNIPGRLDDAVAEYQEAIRLKHDYAAAYDNLGGVLLKMPNRVNEAVAHLQQALLLKPDLADAHDNLGIALGELGRDTEAIAQFKEALRLKPDFVEAHNNLGQTWLKMPERIEDAAGQFEEALRLNPNDVEAHNNLGIALVAKGRIEDGVAQYKEALRLRPSFSDIHFNIAMAILNVPGRRQEAAEELEEYLAIKPENAAARRILAQIKGATP